MNHKTITKTIEKQIITNEDGTHTYELNIKPLDTKNKKRAIIIMLYPTRNESNLLHTDTTLSHILTHLDDIGVGSVTVYNLFSKVVLTRMSSRDLAVDEENMSYIAEAAKTFDKDKDILIFAWGSSMKSSKACNEGKLRLYELFKNYPIHQLTSKSLIGNPSAVHPLYLGISSAFVPWELAKFPLATSIKNITPSKPKEKRKITIIKD